MAAGHGSGRAHRRADLPRAAVPRVGLTPAAGMILFVYKQYPLKRRRRPIDEGTPAMGRDSVTWDDGKPDTGRSATFGSRLHRKSFFAGAWRFAIVCGVLDL